MRPRSCYFSSLSHHFADVHVSPPAKPPPAPRPLTGSSDITVKQCLSGAAGRWPFLPATGISLQDGDMRPQTNMVTRRPDLCRRPERDNHNHTDGLFPIAECEFSAVCCSKVTRCTLTFDSSSLRNMTEQVTNVRTFSPLTQSAEGLFRLRTGCDCAKARRPVMPGVPSLGGNLWADSSKNTTSWLDG